MTTIAKTYAGRTVKEEHKFEDPEFEWGGWNQALRWLYNQGFQTGSLDHPNPVGFTRGRYSLHWKWHNLTQEDKGQLAGILTSEDFRTKPVKVLILKIKYRLIMTKFRKEGLKL